MGKYIENPHTHSLYRKSQAFPDHAIQYFSDFEYKIVFFSTLFSYTLYRLTSLISQNQE